MSAVRANDKGQYNINHIYYCFIRNFILPTGKKTDKLYIQDAYDAYNSFVIANGLKFGLTRKCFADKIRVFCECQDKIQPFIVGWRLMIEGEDCAG